MLNSSLMRHTNFALKSLGMLIISVNMLNSYVFSLLEGNYYCQTRLFMLINYTTLFQMSDFIFSQLSINYLLISCVFKHLKVNFGSVISCYLIIVFTFPISHPWLCWPYVDLIIINTQVTTSKWFFPRSVLESLGVNVDQMLMMIEKLRDQSTMSNL